MSTRRAEFVTVDELLDEVGPDVVRFFFLTRKADSHLEFDLDLAKKQSADNPVFYVQYAHARMCSLIRQAASARLACRSGRGASRNADGPGRGRRRQTPGAYPDVVEEAARALEPHRIVFS